MSTPITKPDDVQPGDAVDSVEYGKMRSRTIQVTVVKATATGLLVRLPDGTEVRRTYSTKIKSTGYGGGSWQHINFNKLDAHDLWKRAQPSIGTVEWSYSSGRGGGYQVVISKEALRLTPLVVIDEVQRLAEWIAAEPAEEVQS